MDTTIKVDSAVRDRLAVLAGERGATIRDLVSELAAGVPTRAELAERAAKAAEYLRTHVAADLDDDGIAAGERAWRALEEGRTPSVLDDQQAGHDRAA